ncbi:hypothetical protein LTR04_006002, partial [Oleoguttula sp. CCFEE 6159]
MSASNSKGMDNVPLQRISSALSSSSSSSSSSVSVADSDFDHLLSSSESEDAYGEEEKKLPAIDGGRQAYVFLLGTWITEAMLWGFPLAFGVFQSYYTSDPQFAGSSAIPTIGTMAIGVSYIGMPFVNPVALRYVEYQRHMVVGGWALAVFGLVAASFATRVWQLVLFQGVLYGAGWVICYAPFLLMLNGWFVRKRGLAYGILFGASGISGLFIPFVVEALLRRFGFRIALRLYAIATVVISGPSTVFMIKPRLSSSPSSPHASAQPTRTTSRRGAARTELVGNVQLYFFALAIFLQGLGFFIPNIFLPSFASSLSLSHALGSTLLALNSLAQVCGQIGFGYVSDKVNIYIPTSASTLLSGLAIVFLWGPAKDFWRLSAFATLWGFFSGSYSVLYTRICTYLAEDPDAAVTLYGIFSFERGIANILEGPLSAWLLGADENIERYALQKYQGLVVFTSVMMFASAIAGVGY